MASRSFEVAAPAEPCNLKLLRGFFEAVLRQGGVAGVDELLLALDEACANVVRHRCGEVDDGMIRVRAELGATEVQLRVVRFCAECDIPKIKPHESTDERPGGFGTGFIAQIMDRVQYVRQPQAPHFMDLVMTKVRGSVEGAR